MADGGKNPVSHESEILPHILHRQLAAKEAGHRKHIIHGGRLCSHCFTNAPGKSGYCNGCRAKYSYLRRRFTGEEFKREWARDAREKQQQAGQE